MSAKDQFSIDDKKRYSETKIKQTHVSTFDTTFWIIFLPFILLIVLICFFPIWFSNYSFGGLDFRQTGQIGDTIGGTMGPFIAIAASILTFFAFWVQYKANEQQKKDLKIERFENKFYELLRLHKSNVDEIRIGDHVQGRKAFVQMFYELRWFYFHAKAEIHLTPDSEKIKAEYADVDLLNLSYKVFFYGIGPQSEKHYFEDLSNGEKNLFDRLKGDIKRDMQGAYLTYMHNHPSAKYFTYNLPVSGLPDDKEIEFHYYPYDGHINKLGHYYRHLFQTAKFIINYPLFDDDQKYEYIKTLRAQLSTFEQLMLYYNALAWFDTEWKEILTKFRLIKNLPLSLADFAENPENHFEKEIIELRKKGIHVFESHEKSHNQ